MIKTMGEIRITSCFYPAGIDKADKQKDDTRFQSK